MTGVRLKVSESGQLADADSFDPGGAIGDVLTKIAPAAPGLPPRFGWQPGGGGSLAQLTNTRWVDQNTTVPLANQTGTVGAPFATLAAGIAALAATGGTLLIVPADYSAEGAIAVDGALTFGFVNVAGLGMAPGSNFPIRPVTLPTLNGSASKYFEGCVCSGNIVSSNLHVEAVATEFHGTVLAHLNFRIWNCSFTRDAGAGPLITVDVGTFAANQCYIRGSGDMASLPAGRHQMFGCTFGAGNGLIDGPAPGVIVEMDTLTNWNYGLAYGANFGANANPQILSTPELRIGTGNVPALAAAALDYLDVNVAVVGLPAIDVGARVNVFTLGDLAPAGAGAGFLAGARVSAPDTVRLTFVGALAGGATNFVFSFG